MPLNLDPLCQAAVDLAKKCVPEGTPLDAGLLLDALYYRANLQPRYPALQSYLHPPVATRRDAPKKVELANDLRPLFQQFAERENPVLPDELFITLLKSDAGRDALLTRGAPESILANLQTKPSKARMEWRTSATRTAAMRWPAWLLPAAIRSS